VLYGTIVFAAFAGIYFWFPKITGRMLDDALGKFDFWATLRRLPTQRRFHHLEHGVLDGAFVLGASTLPFLWNVFRSYRYGEIITVDDPWGYGNSLEWATSCPPPRHNFTELPQIHSERPAFELHYLHIMERIRAEAHTGAVATKKSSFTGLEYCSSCVGCCWITKWAGRRLPGLNPVAHGHGG
jgi:cytochrome c oxidase subunit 1